MSEYRSLYVTQRAKKKKLNRILERAVYISAIEMQDAKSGGTRLQHAQMSIAHNDLMFDHIP